MESNKYIPVVIMAGGYGTRMSNDPERIPKPMTKVGPFPILVHIMKYYYSFGFRKFIICAGYKQEIVKKYFNDYEMYCSEYSSFYNSYEGDYIKFHSNKKLEDWDVSVVNTGLDTNTGGRLLKIRDFLDVYIKEERSVHRAEHFCMTYGDSIGNIDLDELVKFHNSHEKIATVTSVRPPEKYGILDIKDDNIVNTFEEKPDGVDKWVNGGFFVMEAEAFDYIDGDVMFEKSPLRKLVDNDYLSAFHHEGFWHSMDTVKEHKELCDMWDEGNAPWKV